jgi:hypothetical protein
MGKSPPRAEKARHKRRLLRLLMSAMISVERALFLRGARSDIFARYTRRLKGRATIASRSMSALQVVNRVGGVTYDLPPKLTAYLPQCVRIWISKDNHVLRLEGYNEIHFIASQRHKPLRLFWWDSRDAHDTSIKMLVDYESDCSRLECKLWWIGVEGSEPRVRSSTFVRTRRTITAAIPSACIASLTFGGAATRSK